VRYKGPPWLRRARRRLKNATVFRLTRGAIWLLKRLPLDTALRLADGVGELTFRFLRRTRQLALTHIEMALGDELSAAGRERIVRASFRNVARSFCEIARLDEIRPHLGEYVDAEGWQHMEAVLASGKGAIAITGHIGNWEILAAYCAQRGVPVAAIARRIYEPRLNQMLVDLRAASGVKTILRESPNASREILSVLKAGGVLAMLIDQDVNKVPSVAVSFLGQTARTPIAAAALAIRRNVPVLPIFAQRRSAGGHRVVVRPPLRFTPTGNRNQDIGTLTRMCNEAIEENIRKNPAEWVWWHRRWRRKPVPGLDLDSELN